MSYSYSTPVVYGPQNNNSYEINTKEKRKSSRYFAGAILGGGAGALIGAKNKPHMNKSGEIIDSFAKDIYEKSIKELKDGTKEAYEARMKIISKIDSISSVNELRSLINENSRVSSEISNYIGRSLDDFFVNVDTTNLANNKKIIKDILVVKNNSNYQDIKNQIQSCWNTDKKEFIKPSSMTDDLFNTIKKSAKFLKWKNIGICAGIGAIAATITGFILNKIINNRKNV